MIEPGKLRKIKSLVKQGDCSVLIDCLASHLDKADLRLIREQKLLIMPATDESQVSIAAAYAACARQTLDSQTSAYETNYAAFTTLCAREFRALTSRIATHIQFAKSVSLRDILTVGEAVLHELMRGLEKSHHAIMAHHSESKVETQSEFSEYVFHEVNGLRNEVTWAVYRVLNECSRCAREDTIVRLDNRLRECGKRDFMLLVNSAFAWNGIQYLLDKVSYGEWQVAELTQGTPPTIKFNVADLRLERAKIIGIRRYLSNHVLRISTKEQRVKTLEDFGVEVAFQFLDYYLNRSLDNQKAFELETIMRAEIRDSLVCWFFDVLCGFNSMES